MIKIEDNDSPITAACKIIHGTRPYDPTPMMRVVARAITGSDESANERDMFDLNEIKEIADYLLLYYHSHLMEGEEFRWRKTGKWVLHRDGSATCSECHFRQEGIWDLDNWQRFCGHCGANMMEAEGPP